MVKIPVKTDQSARGKLIVLEGNHRAGKTTQILRLKERLGSLGYQILVSRAHSGDVVNRAVDKLLILPASPGFSDQLVRLLLVCAARASRVANEIQPALKAGKIVLSDRYLLSTLIYQGYVGGLDERLVKKVADLSCRGVGPDLTFVLDLPMTQFEHRGRKEKAERDNLHLLPRGYHQKSRQGFLKYARKFNFELIDGSQSPARVEKIIWEKVQKIL